MPLCSISLYSSVELDLSVVSLEIPLATLKRKSYTYIVTYKLSVDSNKWTTSILQIVHGHSVLS